MNLAEAEQIIEGLIFAAEHPLSAREIAEIIELETGQVEALIERLRQRYSPGALLIRAVAGGYQVVTKPELAPWIEKLGRPEISAPLSAAGSEVLAIIAYRQPVTKAEIEQIRGVRSDSALGTLLERELIAEAGRKAGPGRPILYAVTDKFLLHFGLGSLDELPPATDV